MASEFDRRQLIVSLSALVAACKASPSPGESPSPRPVRILPFLDEDDVAVGQVQGTGLDGRLAFDHLPFDEAPLVTTEDFFIRTREPLHLVTEGWVVAIEGQDVLASRLAADAVPRGVVLLECSGNGSNRHFGLISATEWAGVALTDLLDPAEDPLVEVVGYDEHVPPTTNSTPGCSWIFRWSELSEAFLATEMNGDRLTRDHGAPVRLVVPGWYGCANIKWVESIQVVPEGSPSTSQMREFASRTHQNGTPDLAADFRPAVAELSAMVIRVEELNDGAYRFHALAWGRRSGDLTLHIGDWTSDPVPLQGPDTTWEYLTIEVERVPSGEQDLFFTGSTDTPQIRLDQRFYARTVQF